MKFCPKCGSVMIPRKQEGEPVLVCQGCGYSMKAGETELTKHYRGFEKAGKGKVLTTKTVSKESGKKLTKEELEQAREEYYEFVLEQMGEYGE